MAADRNPSRSPRRRMVPADDGLTGYQSGGATANHHVVNNGLRDVLTDVQKQPDLRQIDIDRVGIKDIRFPLTLAGREGPAVPTVGDFSLYVWLAREHRGTHMSRFIEILHETEGVFGLDTLEAMLRKMQARLHSPRTFLEVKFPFFRMKTAPVSKVRSMMDYHVRLWGTLDGDRADLGIEAKAVVTTLCPCSKEISQYGAHNQRGEVVVSARMTKAVPIENVLDLIETSASCEMYSILKRADEKYVTERAYENPRFVEDMVRTVAEKLLADDNVTWFKVSCENQESIHAHNVYAEIEREKAPSAPAGARAN